MGIDLIPAPGGKIIGQAAWTAAVNGTNGAENTVVETSQGINFLTPADMLVTDRLILMLSGEMKNNSSGNRFFTQQLKLGGVAVMSTGASSVVATAVQPRKWTLEYEIAPVGDLQHQVVTARGFVGAGVAGTFYFGTVTGIIGVNPAANVDLSIPKALTTTVTMETAEATMYWYLYSARLTHVRG